MTVPHATPNTQPSRLPWPDQPVVHEVNTAVWLGEVSARAGRPLTLAQVPGQEWDALVPPGISLVWLMGVWSRSAAGREIALANPDLRASWSAALPGWTEADVAGSPYCIREYAPGEELGGWVGLDAAREQLRRRGALLMVDWVPNHVGPDCPWLVVGPGGVRPRHGRRPQDGPAGLPRRGRHGLRAGQGPVLRPLA